MKIRHLRAFLAIAEHGSFGHAADHLLLTQPALTKQVQSLEAQLGGRLFTRGRQGASLTALGRLLLPDARETVRRADLLTLRARRAAHGELGRLSAGFGLSSIQIAPRAVAAFRRRYQDVSITLDDMSSSSQIQRLLRGDLDIGFLRLPAGEGLQELTLHHDRLALATPSGYVVPDPGTDTALWLTAQNAVRLARAKGPGLADQIERFCLAVGAHPDVVQEAHDLQTVLAVVAAGVGIALVPASAINIAPLSVTITPIRHDAAVWRVGAAWNPARATPMVANFVAVVREVASERPAVLGRRERHTTGGRGEPRDSEQISDLQQGQEQRRA